MTRDEIESALLSTMRAGGVGDSDWPSRCDMNLYEACVILIHEISIQEVYRGMRDVIDSGCARTGWVL